MNKFGKVFIINAMSSFGCVPKDRDTLGVDFLISSATNVSTAVRGFDFIIARKRLLEVV